MKQELASLCEKFIENRDTIKGAFAWDSAYIYPVCAAIFTDKGQLAEVEQMRRCRDILREQTGIFSNFRGTVKLAMISMLAVDGNPEGKLQKSLYVYNALKRLFFTSSYLPLASMIIADIAESGVYEEIAGRTRHIYDLMKAEHPFLTSGEDSVFAALLALSELTDEQIAMESEKCYEILKADFFSGNAVQSLSHVLALGEGSAREKCERTIELYRGLKSNGHKYGTSYELPTLGVLALLPLELDVLIEELAEIDGFLSGQKGFGVWGTGKKQRLMYAGMLLASYYIGQEGSPVMTSAAIGSTISLIAAQQAAMCAAVAASSAAAASSGSAD